MKPQSARKLDSKFWSHFGKNVWQKKPCVLEKIQTGLLEIGDAAIFDLLVRFSDRCRQRNDAEGFKFYINGQKVFADEVLQVLPVKKDKTLLGYHARMNALFSDYCLVCDELLKSNSEKQALLTEFTDELYRHVGLPNRFSEMGLYLGNYRKTPFGVHVDPCGVFSFPVVGVKKFRLWTAVYVRKNPQLERAFEYSKFKKDSKLLTVVPGGMSYWPSTAWHIAESDGSFSATWSLGVWVDKPLHQSFAQSLSPLLIQKMAGLGEKTTTAFETLHQASGEVTKLPQDYLRSMAILQGLTTDELHETLLKAWMVHISRKGFKNGPEVKLTLKASARIRLRDPRSPILWQKGRSAPAAFFFSFGGALVKSSKSGGLLSLIKALNAGETSKIRDYLKTGPKNHDLASLQKLADAGAFSPG